jgi:hypothetical protein
MRPLLTAPGIVALAVALAGCDACGNWPWTYGAHGVYACRGGPARALAVPASLSAAAEVYADAGASPVASATPSGRRSL